MGDFKFTWKIENFFLCVNKKDKFVSSPTFIADSIGKTAWCLDVYPYGDGNEVHVACYLNRCEMEGGEKSDIPLDFSFSLIMADGTEQLLKTFKNQVFPVKHRFGCGDLKRRDDILKEKSSLLPKGTLTILCRMESCSAAASISQTKEILKSLANYLYGTEESVSSLPPEMYVAANAVFNNARSQLCPYPEQCTARTNVRVEERVIIWRIENFINLTKGKKVTLPMNSASKSSPSLLLTLYLDDETVSDEHIQVEIRLKKNTTTTHIISKCVITVLNAKDKRCDFNNSQYFFEALKKDQVWKFPSIIKKSKLVGDKTAYLKNDTLSLLCEFTMSDGETLNQIEKTSYFSTELDNKDETVVSLLQIKDDFVGLMAEAELCDVNLLIGKDTVPAHKAVLSARSPVFKAMFDRDMTEKESGIVNVADLDLDTLKRMITYMYGGTVEDIQCENAAKLYSAADKYECLGLKDDCTHFLKENLSVANVCDVLILADMHHDKELSASVYDFILRHLSETLRSEEWKLFMKSKAQLACDTLHRVGLTYFEE